MDKDDAFLKGLNLATELINKVKEVHQEHENNAINDIEKLCYSENFESNYTMANYVLSSFVRNIGFSKLIDEYNKAIEFNKNKEQEKVNSDIAYYREEFLNNCHTFNVSDNHKYADKLLCESCQYQDVIDEYKNVVKTYDNKPSQNV